ncbi:3766_t:CDS:1 [Funneliformis geosporum]|nr:3766_t:CDS:1 [Funneliformis geosporum]
MPRNISEECVKFITNFMLRSMSRLQEELLHDENWKESDNKLNEVTLKILDTLKRVWYNPAFDPKFVEMMNEGTYIKYVVVSAIYITLFDNLFGEHTFITT